jgi:hypothetical protein
VKAAERALSHALKSRQAVEMLDCRIVPGRRAGDGWLVVVHAPGEPMNVLRSFETWAEAQAEVERLAALEEVPSQ